MKLAYISYLDFQGIDDEGEELDINEVEAETESRHRDNGSADDTVGVDPNADRGEQWGEDDCEINEDDTGNDSELEGESDDGFIEEMYDF
jgi:hypothetical protein